MHFPHVIMLATLLLLQLTAVVHSFHYGRISTAQRLQRSLHMSDNMFGDSVRPLTPQRYDNCKMLVTGVVGTVPQERYLSNGHYVLNFALAVIGHFQPVHDWEKYKHTETMWVSVELWDNEAKAQFSNIQKGQKLNGIGYLIFNKWTDKNSGEERKQFRLRLTKIVSDELMKGLLEPIEEVSGSDNGIDDSWQADSNFSGEFLDEMGNKSDSNGNRFDSTNEKDGSASFNDESPVIKNPFEKLWFRRPATTTNKATKSDEWNINGEESQYW